MDLIKAMLAVLVVFRVYLYRKAYGIIGLFYYNLSMLSYTECAEIRRVIFTEGCKKLVDHLSVDATVGLT